MKTLEDYNELFYESREFDICKYNDYRTILDTLDKYLDKKKYKIGTKANHMRKFCKMLMNTELSPEVLNYYIEYKSEFDMEAKRQHRLRKKSEKKINDEKNIIDGISTDPISEYERLKESLLDGIINSKNGIQRLLGKFLLMISQDTVDLLKIELNDIANIALTRSIESFYYLDLDEYKFSIIYQDDNDYEEEDDKDSKKLFEKEYDIPQWFCDAVTEEHKSVKSVNSFLYMIGKKCDFGRYKNGNIAVFSDEFHSAYGINFIAARKIISSYFESQIS